MRGVNIATFLFFVANGVAVVAIPPYLRDLGVDKETLIGFVVSTAFFVSVVARPLSGILGERVGYGRIMRVGVATAVAAQISYLMGTPAWVQVGRVLHGLSIAMFLPMSIAISVTEGPRALASRSLAVGVGNVVGPLLGAYIYDFGGARYPFVVAMALHSTNWLLIRGVESRRGRDSGGGLAVERRVWLFMALLAVYAAVYMGLSTFIPVKLRDSGLPLTLWGVFSSAAASSSLLPRALMARWNLASPGVATVASVFTAAGLVLATYASDYLGFVAAGLVYGVGQGAVVTSYQVLALTRSRKAGLASSIYTMGWDVGSIVGPVVGGGLVESLGYDVLHVLPLFLFFNAAALFIYGRRNSRGLSTSAP